MLGLEAWAIVVAAFVKLQSNGRERPPLYFALLVLGAGCVGLESARGMETSHLSLA